MANIHKKVIKRMTGEVLFLSFLFQALEQGVKGRDEPLLDDALYFVTAADLKNLIDALDRTVNPMTQIPFHMPVAVVYENAKLCQGDQTPLMAQLDEYHRLALIEEFRRKVKASRHVRTFEAAADSLGNDDQVILPLCSPASPTRSAQATK